ncbi:MAG: 3-deoxy-manno-octulosonate cytidylyltransferase [Nitrospirota bacterium]
MKKNYSTVGAVIPARFGSTRFPGKSLVMIKEKPMIQWVYERTSQSSLVNDVVVATDDQRIFEAVKSFGGKAIMTSPDHATGTDRIAEVVAQADYDIVVNVQGDEPLIHPEMIDQTIAPLLADPSISMSTLCSVITDSKEAFDPNVVKVVFDKNGFALYFSRAPIPWDRNHWTTCAVKKIAALHGPVYKHIGLYAYQKAFLLRYAELPKTDLEGMEKLEQLRALEHGYRIKTIVTQHESFGVDIPDDLSKILKRLEES